MNYFAVFRFITGSWTIFYWSRYYTIYETLNIPIWSRWNQPQNFEIYATGKDPGIFLQNPNVNTSLQFEADTIFIFQIRTTDIYIYKRYYDNCLYLTACIYSYLLSITTVLPNNKEECCAVASIYIIVKALAKFESRLKTIFADWL